MTNSNDATTGDVGVVTYRLADDGSITAAWYHSDLPVKAVGTGEAQPIESNGYEGSFKIIYKLPDGTDIPPLVLKIERVESIYQLRWIQEGTVVYFGSGILSENQLVAGWRKT